jgi:hypothetical protein
VAAGELVEGSVQEGIGRVAAWERWRKVWRCSPLRELDRDGLSEEIDDGVYGSVRGAEGEIGRGRELAEWRGLASLVMAWRAAWGAFYRQGEAVEEGGTAASSAAR